MVRPRHRLSGRCGGGSSDPFFSLLCVLCSSALGFLRPRFYFSIPTVCRPACPVYPELRRERSERSASLRSSLATRLPRVSRGHSSLATIPFRIKFFADSHPLTAVESHSYKKRGRAVGSPAPASFLPSGEVRDAQQRQQLQSFHVLTSRFSGYPGGGGLPFSSPWLRALCVSALSFSAPRFSSLSQRRRPQ
jgi:hypothetical protein